MEPRRRSLVSGCWEDISALLPQQGARSPGEQDLARQFSAVRRVHGDGNCFYRAACFAHLESILNNPRALHRFKEQIVQSGDVLLSAGFDEASFSRHQSTLLHVLDRCLAAEQDDAPPLLLRLFNEPSLSDGVVQFLRLLTSAHLQTHADFFCHFVEAPDLKVYCRQEVEAMAMECDHVDILALARSLAVGVHIVSMEGGGGGQPAHHVIPEGAEPTVRLLYQTSHYDILYPRGGRTTLRPSDP